jgi:predicted porin
MNQHNSFSSEQPGSLQLRNGWDLKSIAQLKKAFYITPSPSLGPCFSRRLFAKQFQKCSTTRRNSMDKKLIALLLASLLAVPYAASADVGVYGRIRMGLVNTDMTGTDDNWEIQNAGSRLGFNANTTTNGGTEVFMRYEFAVDGVAAGGITGGRLSYIGFKTGFGTWTFGQQWSTFYDLAFATLDWTDQFFDAQAFYALTRPGRLGESVKWSMTSGPITFGAMAVVDGGTNKESFVDTTQFGVRWDAGMFKLAAVLINDEVDQNVAGTGTSIDTTALQGEIAFGMVEILAALYDVETETSGTTTDRSNSDIQARFKFSDSLYLMVNRGEMENTWEDVMFALVNNLGGGVKIYAEVDSKDYEAGMGTDTDRMAVGVRYDFK